MQRPLKGRLEGRLEGQLEGRLEDRLEGRLKGRLTSLLKDRLTGLLKNRLNSLLNDGLKDKSADKSTDNNADTANERLDMANERLTCQAIEAFGRINAHFGFKQSIKEKLQVIVNDEYLIKKGILAACIYGLFTDQNKKGYLIVLGSNADTSAVYEETAHFIDHATGNNHYRREYSEKVDNFFESALQEAFGFYCSKIGNPKQHHTISSEADKILYKSKRIEKQYRPGLARIHDYLMLLDEATKKCAQFETNTARDIMGQVVKHIPKVLHISFEHTLGWDLGEKVYNAVNISKIRPRSFAEMLMIKERKEKTPLEKYLFFLNEI